MTKTWGNTVAHIYRVRACILLLAPWLGKTETIQCAHLSGWRGLKQLDSNLRAAAWRRSARRCTRRWRRSQRCCRWSRTGGPWGRRTVSPSRSELHLPPRRRLGRRRSRPRGRPATPRGPRSSSSPLRPRRSQEDTALEGESERGGGGSRMIVLIKFTHEFAELHGVLTI